MTKRQYKRCANIARKKLLQMRKVKYRHFCFITKGKKIYTIGTNSTVTHPKSNTYYKAKHAEFDAFTRFKNKYPAARVDNKNILVIRVNGHGQLRMSKPCKHCMDVIMKNNVDRVFYSDENGELSFLHDCEEGEDDETESY